MFQDIEKYNQYSDPYSSTDDLKDEYSLTDNLYQAVVTRNVNTIVQFVKNEKDSN